MTTKKPKRLESEKYKGHIITYYRWDEFGYTEAIIRINPDLYEFIQKDEFSIRESTKKMASRAAHKIIDILKKYEK